jgi:hypothetical protein
MVQADLTSVGASGASVVRRSTHLIVGAESRSVGREQAPDDQLATRALIVRVECRFGWR